MRYVTVIHTSSQQQVTKSTDAKTWGELKSLHSEIATLSSGMKAVIKETKTTIESEESVLPNSDTVIYLTMGKVKAGINAITQKAINEINAMFDQFIANLAKA